MLQHGSGTIVAVTKSKQLDRNQIKTFANEVVILSQINHRKIVQLLGCGLEAETLSQHIHRKDHDSTLSWESFLRIAAFQEI
jgi:hypothetical protein